MNEQSIRILLAEDDKNLGTLLKSYLEAKGYPTVLRENGKMALEEFMESDFDFCIVDVMMPVMDGFTLAEEIRSMNKKIPILFLTAKSMEEDRIKGFEVGGDDYLTKPFSMDELLMRIRAIIRRSEAASPHHPEKNLYKFGAFTFDFNRQVLIHEKAEQKLTSKENELLRLLCENMNDTLDRRLALKKIWFDDSYFNARSMDVYITKLRKYLKKDPSIELINVHGVGFKLIVNSQDSPL